MAAAPPLMNLAKDLTPEEAKMLAEALKQFSSGCATCWSA
jgi:hypothetical protein